jgi:hypothetical protein
VPFDISIFAPVIVLFGLIAGLGTATFVNRSVLPGLREGWVRKHAHDWPTARARLDHACVTEYRASNSEITFRLDAWFTYTVGDQWYEGMYCDEEMRHDAAKKLLSKLNHEPVIVSYNPAKPAEYFYRPSSQAPAVGA